MVKLRRVYETNLYLESKKDLDDLKNYLGDKLFDDYMKIRDRIPKDQNEFKDFSKLKKLPIKDVQDFVSFFQSKSDKKKQDKTEGAKKLYEDDKWVVYKITSYPAAQLYGSGTKWCITGRYPGHEGRGEEYFNDYIEDNNLDGGYYFYISKKNPAKKYCVLQTKNKEIHSVWDAKDTNKGDAYDRIGVRLPIIKEVNLSMYSEEGFIKAIKSGNKRKIKEYITKSGIPVEEVIYYLQDIDDTDIIDLFIEVGADLSDLLAPLVYHNKDNIVSHIINKSLKDLNLDAALGYCFYNGEEKPDLAKFLLQNGANPNKYNGNMYTPLYEVIRNGSHDMLNLVNLLLKYGADPNFDLYHENYLRLASMKGYYDVVKTLLEHGAVPDYKGDSLVSDKKTALSLAKKKGYKDIVDLLKKYGAKE